MTSTMEITESLQDGFLKALETSQRLTLEAFGAGMSSLKDMMPTGPSTPLVTSMFTPQDAINSSFRFAEMLLESQRSFLTAIAEIAEPMTASTKKAAKD